MDRPTIVKSHDVHLDSEYAAWIHDIKERYRNSQIKAAVKVNAEQLFFNWMLGRDLVTRKAEEKWSAGIVEQISIDLKNEFLEAKGFSTTNLWYMKKWYLFYYSSACEIADSGKMLLEKETEQKLYQLGGEGISLEKLHQLGGETPLPQIFVTSLGGIMLKLLQNARILMNRYFIFSEQFKKGGVVLV